MLKLNRDRPEPIIDRNTILTFGKYKGESIADILEVNPQYLCWLHETCDEFELDHKLLEEAETYKQNNDENTWRYRKST